MALLVVMKRLLGFGGDDETFALVTFTKKTYIILTIFREKIHHTISIISAKFHIYDFLSVL